MSDLVGVACPQAAQDKQDKQADTAGRAEKVDRLSEQVQAVTKAISDTRLSQATQAHRLWEGLDSVELALSEFRQEVDRRIAETHGAATQVAAQQSLQPTVLGTDLDAPCKARCDKLEQDMVRMAAALSRKGEAADLRCLSETVSNGLRDVETKLHQAEARASTSELQVSRRARTLKPRAAHPYPWHNRAGRRVVRVSDRACPRRKSELGRHAIVNER